MKKNFEDYSFSEFLKLTSEYVKLAKENNLVDLTILQQEHPGAFSEEAATFIHDFLNSCGITDEMLDKLKKKKKENLKKFANHSLN